ncbi:MAG: hypothetical protein ACI4UX_01375 [Clostridia bacterium]
MNMQGIPTTILNYPKQIGTKIEKVQKGDYFELCVYGRVNDILSGSNSRTWLTIEALN